MTTKPRWAKGDVYGPNDSDIYTAGIHVSVSRYTYSGKEVPGCHWNGIEFYGDSEEDAVAHRDFVLKLAVDSGEVIAWDGECDG